VGYEVENVFSEVRRLPLAELGGIDLTELGALFVREVMEP